MLMCLCPAGPGRRGTEENDPCSLSDTTSHSSSSCFCLTVLFLSLFFFLARAALSLPFPFLLSILALLGSHCLHSYGELSPFLSYLNPLFVFSLLLFPLSLSFFLLTIPSRSCLVPFLAPCCYLVFVLTLFLVFAPPLLFFLPRFLPSSRLICHSLSRYSLFPVTLAFPWSNCSVVLSCDGSLSLFVRSVLLHFLSLEPYSLCSHSISRVSLLPLPHFFSSLLSFPHPRCLSSTRLYLTVSVSCSSFTFPILFCL